MYSCTASKLRLRRVNSNVVQRQPLWDGHIIKHLVLRLVTSIQHTATVTVSYLLRITIVLVRTQRTEAWLDITTFSSSDLVGVLNLITSRRSL